MTVEAFEPGEAVKVAGISIGKGFQGTIKRHNFARGPVSHGSHNVRKPGSIGASATPARVFKGQKMAGRMGGKRITQPGLVIHDVDVEQNLLLVKGSIPGPKSGIVEIREASDGRPKAPLLGGSAAKDVSLEAGIFGAELKPHVVHETVRAELNARRAGTRGVKSRGLVAGGRSKPWRQKGTGRARAGTIRAPQFTGGGVTFAVGRVFDQKVNRKARRSALRGALSSHAQNGTLGLLSADVVRRSVDEAGEGARRGLGQGRAAPARRHRGGGDADQVVPQPPEDADHGSVRARGRLGRLGALAPDHRGRAAARPGEGCLMSSTRTRSCSLPSSRRRATA